MNSIGIGTELRTEIINVTPAMAQEWLENHNNYRGLRNHRVAKHASEMARGEWQCPGPPLIFDKEGMLMDGQHRLAAVVRSGMTISFVCLFGYEQRAASVIDRGMQRNHGDTLAAEGFVNAYTLAAAARRLYFLLLKRPIGPGIQPSYAQVRGLIDDHPGLIDAVSRSNDPVLRKMVPRAWLAPAMYLCQKSDREAADAFFELLATGENLLPGSPVKALRDRLMFDSGKNRRGIAAREKYALTIKAFNAYRSERDIKQLKWLANEALPEVE